MWGIPEQRGLIDVASRVSEPEIAATEDTLRSSTDLAGIRAMLGTSHAVVTGLIGSGLLTPFVQGGRRTKARPRVPGG